MAKARVELDENGLDPNRWRALFVIAIASLMVVLDASIVNIALPSAQAELGISDANRQWVVTAYSLAFGSLLLLGGLFLLRTVIHTDQTGDDSKDSCPVGEYKRQGTLALWTYSITFRDSDGDGWGKCVVSEERTH